MKIRVALHVSLWECGVPLRCRHRGLQGPSPRCEWWWDSSNVYSPCIFLYDLNSAWVHVLFHNWKETNMVVLIWKEGREGKEREGKTASLWGWLPALGWGLFASASWIHTPELTDLTRTSSVCLCHDTTIFFSHYFRGRICPSRLNVHFDRSSCTPPSLLSPLSWLSPSAIISSP